jgi:predicted nucleic acid-binding protein
MLESGFSARNLEGHQATITGFYATWEVLKLVPELAEIALDLQSRLFARGIGRSVGSFDLIVAAHAIYYTRDRTRVVVVHYDEDYERLEQVAPELATSWLVPRGSLP